MRSLIAIVLALASSISVVAQDSAGEPRKELEAVHARWFKAFDSGDGATMDQMEMSNLILVMSDGTIFSKTKPRAELSQNGRRTYVK